MIRQYREGQQSNAAISDASRHSEKKHIIRRIKVEAFLLDAGEGDFDFFVMLSLDNNYSVS